MNVKFPTGDQQIRVCKECCCPRSFADLVVLENYEKVTGKEIYESAVSLIEMRKGMEQEDAPSV